MIFRKAAFDYSENYCHQFCFVLFCFLSHQPILYFYSCGFIFTCLFPDSPCGWKAPKADQVTAVQIQRAHSIL